MTLEMTADPYHLERFIAAQKASFARVRRELAEGRKTSHWMWFVFPQIAGLGSSEMSQHYAITSIEEARAYLDHPVLGARYRECVAILQDLVGFSADAVFGPVDAAKLRSSLTLFNEAAPADALFEAALLRWFKGAKDARTLQILAGTAGVGTSR